MLDESYLAQIYESVVTTTTVEKVQTRVYVPQAIRDLRQGGILSQRLANYQERPSQIEGCLLVDRALRDGTPTLIEAWTGTGKSLMYLLSCVRAHRRVLVSTANKALQDQIFNKDIPFIKKHIEDFNAVMIKGKTNYVCKKRMQEEVEEGMQRYAQDATFNRVSALVDEEATLSDGTLFNGDFDSLDFRVPDEIKTKINVDEICTGRKCPLYQECYYYKAKRAADTADVIVTNTAMLMEHVKSGGRIFRKPDAIIIDECHHLEDNATSCFTVTVTPGGIRHLLNDSKIKAYAQKSTIDQAVQHIGLVWDVLQQCWKKHKSGDSKLDLSHPIEEGLHLASLVGKLATQVAEKKPDVLSDEESLAYDKRVKRLEEMAKKLRHVFSVNNEEYTYYIEESGKDAHLEVSMVLIDVSPKLQQLLFDQNTVICVSATVATKKREKTGFKTDFSFYQNRVGMDTESTIAVALPPVFDYNRQCLVYIPRNTGMITADGQKAPMPIPVVPEKATPAQVEEYEIALGRQIYQLVKASGGRAFLLFSSGRVLNNVLAMVKPHLDYPIFVQGDKPTQQLVKAFKASGNGVLFGLKTYSEGIDIQGAALSLVVIDKIPFIKTDPISKARMELLDGKGFADYLLPQALLQLKQAAGRLIRTDTDRGVVALLDSRAHLYPYGDDVKACLAGQHTDNLKDVRNWYAQESRNIA